MKGDPTKHRAWINGWRCVSNFVKDLVFPQKVPSDMPWDRTYVEAELLGVDSWVVLMIVAKEFTYGGGVDLSLVGLPVLEDF